MDALTRDLSRILGDDSVSEDPADKSAYAHDLWPRQLISTRGGLSRPAGPRAVAWPRDAEQLSAVIEYARHHGARVTPFGAASAVTGAVSLEPDVIAVDTKRMRTLHAVDVEAGTAVADAGILGEHLEQRLNRRGATLGHFPSSIYISTLGGWIATRSAGQCSGRYGKIEDMVLALEGVLPTGESFRVGPPREGEVDARSLIVGSESLAGFITRATMRVWPAPAARQFAAFTFQTMEQAWTAIRMIYQAGLRPAVARLYDPFDTYIFKTGGRSHAPRTRSAGTRRPVSEFVIRRVLPFVKPVNKLNESFGEKVFGRSLLVLVFECAPGEDATEAFARAGALARDNGGQDEGEALARRWLARRHGVSYRQPPTFTRGIWVDTMEVAAPWSKLGALYDGVREALAAGGFVMAHMSHAYPDGCSIYFTFAGASPDDGRALENYLRTWSRALEAAHRAGGTIAHHHGVGRSKRGAMRLELAAGVGVIAALADAADPGRVMARGPLVPPVGEGMEEPVISAADVRPTAPVVLDADSRLATLDPSADLSTVHAELQARGFTLEGAPASGRVRDWLARGEPGAVCDDPVDHRVAGYAAVLPSGAVARTLPAPRRAAGPDLFTLFAQGGGRFGALASVTVRVKGADETGPAWTAPYRFPRGERDPAVESWLARAAQKLASTKPG